MYRMLARYVRSKKHVRLQQPKNAEHNIQQHILHLGQIHSRIAVMDKMVARHVHLKKYLRLQKQENADHNIPLHNLCEEQIHFLSPLGVVKLSSHFHISNLISSHHLTRSIITG